MSNEQCKIQQVVPLSQLTDVMENTTRNGNVMLNRTWLLIYRIDKENRRIIFYRTGSHSDLF